MVGGQTSLEVGFAAAIVSVFIGTLYGALSGFIGGPVDSFLMRIVDAGLSIPYIMVVIILSVIFHPNTVIMIFIIAVFYWLGVARLVRGETLTLRTREYVQAVKVVGGGRSRAIVRHIMPERDRHDHRPGHVRGRGLDPDPGRPRLPRPRRPAARHRLGGHAVRRPDLHAVRHELLVADLPAGHRDHRDLHRFNFIGDALRDAFETRLQRR